MTEASVRLHIKERQRTGLSGRSLQRELSGIRSFFTYLVNASVINSNPGLALRGPKSVPTLPNILYLDEVLKILESPPEDNFEIRDVAMWELLYSTGLRLSELVALNYENIDLVYGEVFVEKGKGGRGRYVPLGKKATNAIKRWLEIRSKWPKANPTGALFITSRGSRIAARSVQLRLLRWGQKLGFGKPISPHVFRHTFACHMLERSGNLRAIQELLGHSNLATTQLYTRLDINQMATTYAKAHPRARRQSSSSQNQ